jgi:oligosaccharide repeat unit polymerase
MNLESSIVVLLVLTVGNYWLKRSVLYPPFLFCSMWFLSTSLDWLDIVETDPVHPTTLAFIVAGAVLFTAGGLLALLVPKALVETRLMLTRFPQRNNVVKPLLILFLLFGIPMQIQNLRAQAAQGEGGTIFERARNAGIAAQRNGQGIEGMSSGISIYFVSWTVFTAFMFMLKGRDRSFWLVTFLALLATILTTGRTSLLQLFSGLICVHLLTTGRVRFWAALKVTRIPLLLFAFLFIGLIFVNKTEQSQNYATGIAQIALVFFITYIVGPLAAFDYFLQNLANFSGVPHHTFKFYLGILAHFHLIQYAPAPMLQEFAAVPYPVNVYTMYRDYVLDFGISGALATIAIIGFLHVLLYRKALTGSFLGCFLFAISIFPVTMSIFSDQYSSFGNFTNAMLFGGIYIILLSLPIRFLPSVSGGYGVPPKLEIPDSV